MTQIAAIQLNATSTVGNNIIAAQLMAKRAVDAGAKMLVFPEHFAYVPRQPEEILLIKESLGQGRIQAFLHKLARELNVWIVAGSMPLATANERMITNTCLVYNNQGECVYRYDKQRLFDAYLGDLEQHEESRFTVAGDQCGMVNTPFGKLGLVIGSELRYADIFKMLRKQGAEIIALMAQFPALMGGVQWRALVTARAVDAQAYLIAANQFGLHENHWKSYGNSMVVDPWGTMLTHRVDGHGFVAADCDLKRVSFIRSEFPLV